MQRLKILIFIIITHRFYNLAFLLLYTIILTVLSQSNTAFCNDTLGTVNPLVSAEQFQVSYGWYDRRPLLEQANQPFDRTFSDSKYFGDGSVITYKGDFSVTISYPDGRPDKVVSYADHFYPNGDRKPVIHTEIPRGSDPENKNQDTPTKNTSTAYKNWSFKPIKTYLSSFWDFFKKAMGNLGKTREIVYAPPESAPVPPLLDVDADLLIETLCLRQIDTYLVNNTEGSFSDFLHNTLVFCSENCPAESRFFTIDESVLQDLNSDFNLYMKTLIEASKDTSVPDSTRNVISLYQLSLYTMSKFQVNSATFTLWLNNNPQAMEMYKEEFIKSAREIYGELYIIRVLDLFPPK